MAEAVPLVPTDPILFFIAWYIRGESSCPCCRGRWHWAEFGGWDLGEVLENTERWAGLMFAHLTPVLSPQGPPGGGGPPGTPIMPSPAGTSPLRPLSLQGHPCPVGNDQFLWLLAFWEVSSMGFLTLGLHLGMFLHPPVDIGAGGAQEGEELSPHPSQPGVELFFTVEFL